MRIAEAEPKRGCFGTSRDRRNLVPRGDAAGASRAQEGEGTRERMTGGTTLMARGKAQA